MCNFDSALTYQPIHLMSTTKPSIALNLGCPDLPRFVTDFPDLAIELMGGARTVRWVNAFGPNLLGPTVCRLFPTETLFGDWRGNVLLLAQDPMPASALRTLIAECKASGKPIESAWRHADRQLFGDKKGIKTNERLKYLVQKYLGGVGVVYGSASAHMLFDDGVGATYSQNLAGFYSEPLQTHLQRVLSWVVENMANITHVVCLGEKAWDLCVSTAGLDLSSDLDFKQCRDSGRMISAPIADKQLSLIPVHHPAARISKSEIEKNWELVSISTPSI
jgi:hypothetical protein